MTNNATNNIPIQFYDDLFGGVIDQSVNNVGNAQNILTSYIRYYNRKNPQISDIFLKIKVPTTKSLLIIESIFLDKALDIHEELLLDA
jgi:hypothetical protein